MTEVPLAPETPAPPSLPRIGRYDLVRRLGGSANIDVWLALAELEEGRPSLYTLKIVERLDTSAQELADELASEVSVLERLHHSTIVRLVDLFEEDQKLVLALEYVEGGSLEDLMRARAERSERMPDEAVFYAGSEIAAALSHAHDACDSDGEQTPVIHRNLHPGAVLVAVDGRVRLSGFGIGKILGRSPDTMFGRIKGTPGYMAPEQFAGERVTPRTDVYGLALLVASMLMGRSPRSPAPSVDDLILARDDLPEGVLQALATALEPRPQDRRITCAELEQWLAQAGDKALGQVALREELRTFRAGIAPPAATPATLTQPRPRPVVPLPPTRPPEPRDASSAEMLELAAARPAIDEIVSAQTISIAPPPTEAPVELVIDVEPVVEEAEPPAELAPEEPVSLPPEDRPLTTGATMAVTTLVAAIVVGAGLLIAEHDLSGPSNAVPSQPSALPAAGVSAPPSAARRPAKAPPTTASARTPTTPSPPTSAPAPRTSAPPTLSAPNPATLPADRGLLTVTFPAGSMVYLNGVMVGKVNAMLDVHCGQAFLRVGSAPPGGGAPTWLSPGVSVAIACRAMTRKDMTPTPSATGITQR